MEMLIETMREFDVLIMLGIIGLLLILIILQIVNKVHMNKLSKRYNKLLRNSKEENIENLVIEYGNRVEKILGYTKDVHNAYKGIDERISGCIQKIGMVRYKAFEDIGSDLSYSIALLDETDTGIIITGIYGRDNSTTFAKPIDNGISKYDLSDEEKEAIEKARKAFSINNKERMDSLNQLEDLKDYKTSKNKKNKQKAEEKTKEDTVSEDLIYEEIKSTENINDIEDIDEIKNLGNITFGDTNK